MSIGKIAPVGERVATEPVFQSTFIYLFDKVMKLINIIITDRKIIFVIVGSRQYDWFNLLKVSISQLPIVLLHRLDYILARNCVQKGFNVVAGLDTTFQIGRASCRERVEISV